MSRLEHVNPPELGRPSGFSHAVIGRGRTVFLAGQTALDAEGRIVGDTVVEQFERALGSLDPSEGSLLFVENVGNLVCPALFDVGEHRRVVVVSVTEGDDKPLKYPQMFAAADLLVVNKTDLLPYVDCDLDVVTKNARGVNPGVDVLPLSVRDGSGMDAWYAWLDRIGDTP